MIAVSFLSWHFPNCSRIYSMILKVCSVLLTTFVLSCLSLGNFAALPAHAADAQPWTLRKGTLGGRFAGDQVSGPHARTTVDDDELAVIRDEASGRGYLRFELNSNAHLSEQYAYAFIYDGPNTKSSKRVRLKASAWITPDPNGNGGVILLSLSASDIATLQSYDGNIMGVAYEIRRQGDSSYSDKAFLFLGKGIGAALAGLGLDKPIKFAALAVKNSDGTFGYAFDHDTREEAVERAVAECTKRGGENCDTKLVLSGPACIAYHSEPDSSVFGWGFSKDQGAATSRAAKECASRNDDMVCRSTSWSCNTRMEAPVNVVFEAPNDSKRGVGACHAVLHMRCNNFENLKTKKGTVINGINIHAGLKQMIEIDGCGATGKSGMLVVYKRGDGNWKKLDSSKDFTADDRAKVRPILERYRDTAKSIYPACEVQSVSISMSQSKEKLAHHLEAQWYSKVVKINF
ncbi:hypothetical protein Q669_31800 [Labrenzia sp. C1B10]|uniref:DUF4189 domain-containing protein n=1 Tax=unclassified Labrenzia TaxID=2648686 RepID=UPI0003B83AA3|nr:MULTISPECIES: DUF4189 domain-containing protein [unclassified Labrenzia]ERP92851.1 hypothetical protein Q669_31800 [Labrenzia sp. C1B10]